MRYWRSAVALIATCVFASTACTRQVNGVPQADMHQPGTSLSTDDYGLVVGFPDAPVQLEAYIEPQCPHCAHFEATYGEQIDHYVRSGKLALTYRPLTFIDKARRNHYSARVSNALFLAARTETSATAFQDFVQDLYRHQDHSGDGPSNANLASMARESGIDNVAVQKIAAGDSGVDVTEMDDANGSRLDDVEPNDPGTPTVYDLKGHDVVDIQDPGWLAKLIKSA